MNGSGRRFVIGFDGARASLAALRAAVAMAEPPDSLTVIHAYWIPPEVRYYEFFDDVEHKFAEVGHEVLEPAKRELSKSGLTVDYEALPGKAADVLRSVAGERGASLLVVGTHGESRVRSALGSVTHKLLHDPPCPVLVVPS
ncbi:MAG: universal stress protein [Solirubrobacterales bacterium]